MALPKLFGDAWQRHVLAVLLIAAAAALRLWLLEALEYRLPYVTFYPAVMIAALCGGLMPGLLATLLSCLAVAVPWLVSADKPFVKDLGDWLGLAIFVTNCTVVSAIAEAMRRARTRAKIVQLDLQRSNAELKAARDNLEEEVKRRTAELVLASGSLEEELAERKRAEEALRASEEKHRNLFQNAPIGVFQSTVEGTILDANPVFAHIYGYESPEEVIDCVKDVAAQLYVEPEKRGQFIEMSYGDDRLLSFENQYRKKDGTVFTGNCHLLVVPHDDGSVSHLEGFVEDITERKKAEEALRESEERYRAVFNNAAVGITLSDPDGRYLRVNSTSAYILGYTQEELEGLTFFDVTHPEDVNASKEQLLSLQEGKKDSYRLEKRYIRKDGQVIWAEVSVSALRDVKGEYKATLAVVVDITERKKAEAALRESESMLRNILATSPVGIVGMDENRIIKWVNEACLNMFGFKRKDQVVGRSAAFVYPSDAEYNRMGRLLYEGITTGKITSGYATLKRRDGSLFEGHIRMKAFGLPGLAIAAISDISDRKKAAEALRDSEEKYRLVVEKAQEAIFVAQEGMFRFVNPKTVEILGYTEKELLTTPFNEIIYAEDREMVFERHIRRLRGEEVPARYAFRLVDKVGTLKWVEIDSAVISWAGTPAALAFMTDITERMRMEEELKESEERYRILVEESFDGIFIQKGPKILFANSRLYAMLGYSAGELEGLDHWRVYHADYQELTRDRAIARMRGEEVVSQYEVKLQRKDGTSFAGEISAREVNVKGEPGVLVWVRDISARRRSEEVQRRLATAVEQAAETIVITDIEGSILYVNPAFEKITGYSRQEAIGNNPRILKSGKQDEKFYDHLWQTITSGAVWSGHFITRKKNGVLFEEEATITPIKDNSGKIVNYVAVKRDVTKELSLQKQLLQSQKMEAIGTLAGGIAHDFNNLLQVTSGYSELLLEQKSKDDPEYADLMKILQAAKNGAELVQRLLTFSRKVEPKPVPVDLNRLVIQVEKLLRRTIPKMIEIRLDLSADLSRMNADATQMEQVLMNLAVNARDAMPDGGTLVIGTHCVTLDEEWCKLRGGLDPGNYVLLTISDTGHGMEKDTVEHIFEPFYTTKELGRGTGLGLAMVYGIVTQHKGRITCESEIGRGTVFNLYFPAIETHDEPDVAQSGVMPAFGTETLLLVDDEELIRDLGVRILSKAGYQVLAARNGKEALELFKKERARLSLVILDMIMPEMGGKECLRELLNMEPGLKVLVASGLSADSSTQEFLELGTRGFVAKPFKVKELLRQVRTALDND
ncbi:MAG TPA: PAS domain S-box protein [Desulfomonilaceae bacterium]|nr:PAS domain S-box protein [Desulfomonilaceae bacterium]